MLELRFLIKYVLCVIACFGTNYLIAQEVNQKEKWLKTIETGGGFPYSGLNANAAFLLKNKKNEYYVGLKLILSDSYLLQKGPFGIQLGYRRNVLEGQKLKSFLSLDYQLVRSALYNPLTIDTNKKNRLNELFFSFGLQYQVAQKMWIGSSFGFGLYMENNYDLRNAVRNRYIGTNNMLRIFVNYVFKK